MSLLDQLRDRISKFKIEGDRAILMVCMGIALVFWLLVKLSKDFKAIKEVNFQFVLSEDQAYTVYPPESCEVEIEGTGWDLMFDFFVNPEINLYYDLGKVQNLNFSNSRLSNDISEEFTSSNISIERFNFDGFVIELEERIERRLPIKLNADFKFSPDYHQKGEVLLDPDSVSVTGPKTILSELWKWETDSLILGALTVTTEHSVRLETPQKEVSLSANQTEVTVEVEQFTERSFFIPVNVKNAPDSLKIFPEKIMLTCIVGISQYNEISPEHFTLEVDLEGAKMDLEKNTVPVVLTDYPGFVKNVYFSPKSAQYFIIDSSKEGKEP